MSRKSLAGVSIGIAVVVAAACFLWPGRSRRDNAVDQSLPNILLVTLDTTRADHIGAYGWRHARTPTFDGLAARGVRFECVYAPVPLTLPSHATLMTGLYPFYHGVRDNGAFRLDDSVVTLGEVLREQGYQTGAAVAAFVLDHRFGLDQGFGTYLDDLPDTSEFERFVVPERNAGKIADAAIEWIGGTSRDRPYFFWAHMYDPHRPYRTPPSFPLLLGHPYDAEIAYADQQLGRLLQALEETPPNDRETVIVVTADHGEALGQHREETHGYFVYDSTLRVPLVVCLPDDLRAGQTVRTPVSLADVMPTVLDIASLAVPGAGEIHGRSLVPLIEEAAGAAEAFSQRPIYFECYAPAYNFGWAAVQGVRVGDDKYIESPVPELYRFARSDREGPAHDRSGDEPDMIARLKSELRELVETPLARPAETGHASVLDAEAAQKLRSLGYFGNAVSSGPATDPARDLKRMLPKYNSILSGAALIGAGAVEAAVDQLLAVYKEDPGNGRCLWLLAQAVATGPLAAGRALPVVEDAGRNRDLAVDTRAAVLVSCGRAYLQRREPDGAMRCFQAAAALVPDDAFVHAWLGVWHLHAADPSQAVLASKKAVDLAPGVDALAVQLGLAYFCDGRRSDGAKAWEKLLLRDDGRGTVWDIAERCAQDRIIAEAAREPLAAAGADASLPAIVRAAAWAAAGQIAFGVSDGERALAAFQAADRLLGDQDASVLWWEAQTLARLGRSEEAYPLLKRAYDLAPDRLSVVAELAVHEHGRGDTGEAVRLLSVYHESHPDDVTAMNNLAWVLAEQGGDLERALRLARTAFRHRDSSAAFADTLGWVHLRRGEAESAVYVLKQAVRIAPEIAGYYYHLGLAHRLVGETAEAREAFARAVQLAPRTPRPAWLAEARAGAAGL